MLEMALIILAHYCNFNLYITWIFCLWSLEIAYESSGLLMDYASCLNLTTQVPSELGFDLLEWRIGDTEEGWITLEMTRNGPWGQASALEQQSLLHSKGWYIPDRAEPGHSSSSISITMLKACWSSTGLISRSESQILTQYYFIVT